jgi:hypothetical protein
MRGAMAERDEQPLPPEVLEQILEALKGLRYGSIEITLQNSKVVQLERKEKKRLGNDTQQD